MESTDLTTKHYLGRHVEFARWLPSPLPADSRKLVVVGSYDYASARSGLEVLALSSARQLESYEFTTEQPAALDTLGSWEHPGRVTALHVSSLTEERSLVISGSSNGTFSFRVADSRQLIDSASNSQTSSGFLTAVHKEAISAVDYHAESQECLTAGEDGRICIVNLAHSQAEAAPLIDNSGTLSFTSVRWTSPSEFVSASCGGGLQWWDRKTPQKPVMRSPIHWGEDGPGTIHSIDIHPSRNHICAVAGSGGSVLAWDLRYLGQPLVLASSLPSVRSGGKGSIPMFAESEVWEVKFDLRTQQAEAVRGKRETSGNVPPVMACSEDGVLAVLLEGDYLEVVSESCAINSFDIEAGGGQVRNGREMTVGVEEGEEGSD